MLQLGLYCIFAEPLGARSDEVAALMTDPRWPWQPQLMDIGNIAGRPRNEQVKGKIPIAKLPAAVRTALAAEHASNVMLACSRKQALEHAWIRIHTGRDDRDWNKVQNDLMAM